MRGVWSICHRRRWWLLLTAWARRPSWPLPWGAMTASAWISSTIASTIFLVQGARPLFFLDYIASNELDPRMIAAIVSGIAAACRDAGCALIGGETAEMRASIAPGSSIWSALSLEWSARSSHPMV